ncbi:MAG: tRNA pseudouridine(38-40) synthase TruA [Erysipelotrichaceae bacterium]|jgi:tRNA pseudouridine38-40 synthase|nr:tRNA pseudouridine(38-40) synthase TruA [Erysipelotrichaceae bacterium]
MRYLATVSYNGTNYCGWQKQPQGLSVQMVIEDVLSGIINQRTGIYASGRTDAGVHAIGQTFHFDSKEIADLSRFTYSLNLLLPSDIKIVSIKAVPASFDARKSVTKKEYRYFLVPRAKDPFIKNIVTLYAYPFDIKIINEILHKLQGFHNFKGFTSKKTDLFHFKRTINLVEFSEGEYFGATGFCFRFIGDGFMRYQIRMMVGTILAIASGKASAAYLDQLLMSDNKEVTRYNADPNGLYLWEVSYD